MRVSGKHNDLDNVGPSLRHHTFFEMLGNFSFGDYFKEDAIRFAWTLLTDVWELPKDRLHATIFAGDADVPRDDEAYTIWRIRAGRAHRGTRRRRQLLADGRHRPVRPLLRDLLYDRQRHGPRRRPERPARRNLEQRLHGVRPHDGGALVPLPAPSIDTGMGLERITAVIQGKTSNYDTDLFQPLLAAIGELAGAPLRRHETRPTSRCASSPITCAP